MLVTALPLNIVKSLKWWQSPVGFELQTRSVYATGSKQYVTTACSDYRQVMHAPVLHVESLICMAGSTCFWSSRSPWRTLCASWWNAPVSSTGWDVRSIACAWPAPRRRPTWRSCSGSSVGRRNRRQTEAPSPSYLPPSPATPSLR